MKIGIIGGGQLGKMLAEASSSLNHTCVIYDPDHDCCAAASGKHFCSRYDDWESLKTFAAEVDIITYEFEHVPVKTLEFLKQFKNILPDIDALEYTQDRLKEKRLFKSLGIPTVKYYAVSSLPELATASLELGFPFILKSRSGGYDGKGQIEIKSQSKLKTSWESFSCEQLIAEEKFPYKREVSIIGSRDCDGNTVFYDLCENKHTQGILSYTSIKKNDPLHGKAIVYAEKLMSKLNYTGTLTIEFFDSGEILVANEYAPRVHNSGHWSIEGAAVSQFENHIRAVTGMALGSTASIGSSLMFNVIGKYPHSLPASGSQSIHYHSYGKSPATGRKIGHITIKSSTVLDSKACYNELFPAD
jgi:5-(carboxyamino)imidazole ribonucleotide synthase